MTDEQFMRLALAKARDGVKGGQSPFGACVVQQGRVVACVHNVVWATTDITDCGSFTVRSGFVTSTR